MAAAPRTQRKLGGLRATRAKKSPDAVKGRKLQGRRRSPKLGRGSPLPSAEDVVQTHGYYMDAPLDHEALASLLCQLRATPSEDVRKWHRERKERGGGGRQAAPLQAKSGSQKMRELGVAAQDAARQTGQSRHEWNTEVEGQTFTFGKKLLRKCSADRGIFNLGRRCFKFFMRWHGRPYGNAGDACQRSSCVSRGRRSREQVARA